jgi:hypothetical protein
VPGDDSQVALCQYGKQLGNYSFTEACYREYLGNDRWGPATIPPVEQPPCPEKYRKKTTRLGGKDNYGVDLDHLAREATYALNGRRVQRHEAFQAILAGNSLTDDTRKLRVTVIGDEKKCAAVVKDLKAAFGDDLLIQSYRPGHWALKVFNLDQIANPPDPIIFVESPPDSKGRARVLYTQFGYDGDDDAGKLVEAVRQADPNFRPHPSPDPRKPPEPPKPQPNSPDPKPFLESIPLGMWILLAAFTLVLTRRKS